MSCIYVKYLLNIYLNQSLYSCIAALKFILTDCSARYRKSSFMYVLFISDDDADSSSDGETGSTSKRTIKSFSWGKAFSNKKNVAKRVRKQKDFTCKKCDITFSSSVESRLHSKKHKKKEFHCGQCAKNFNSYSNLYNHTKTHSSDNLSSDKKLHKHEGKAIQVSSM